MAKYDRAPTEKLTKQEMIDAIKRLAEKLGRAPSSREFSEEVNVSGRHIRSHFGTWSRALMDSGVPFGGWGIKATMDDLFRDWVEVARGLGRVPVVTDYELRSRFSVRPLIGRFNRWKNVAGAMRRYVIEMGMQDQYRDVIDMIDTQRERYLGAKRISLPGQPWKATLRNDRPVYGEPLLDAGLTYGPANEGGVIFLFGMLARELGFAVTRIQQAFPDCEAFCEIEEGKWQRVTIEFEYSSRNFAEHGHDLEGCDLIVCWVNDWTECPLEVLELRNEVRRLFAPRGGK